MKVFISYSRKDAEFVNKLKEALEASDIGIIIDVESLKFGDNLQEFVERSVRGTDLTIAVISENSLQSVWVIAEALETLMYEHVEGRKRFLPIYIDTSFLDDTLYLEIVKRIDASITTLQELTNQAIEKHLGTVHLDQKRGRFITLRNNLDKILKKLADVLVADFSSEAKFTENLPKLLEAIAEAETQREQVKGRPSRYLAPFQAPPLPQHFVPRPEVTDALKARLLSDEPTIPGILVISAIHGLGGIGKSTVAAALAYDKEVQERFPDGILWATLGQQPEILSLISGWIHALRDYDFRPTTIEAASVHLRTLLQDKAVLLVVDDVWQPEHAIHFKVGGPRCQVLITTRRADVADEVGAELHQMDVMTPGQALDLLAARVQRPLEPAEREEALSLAEAVGYLPLALELAAVRIARGMSWKALCDALEQEVVNLETLEGSPRRRRKKETTLEVCFNFSLNVIRSDDEDAWRAFVWLGVLPEDTQIAAPMAATLWEMEQAEAQDLLELLWNDALLLPGSALLIGDKEWPAYRLHDLLHDIACKLLTTEQPQGLALTLQDAHAALLERYKQHTQNDLWHTLPDDRYIHAHLTWHFQQASQVELIHVLLREGSEDGHNGWYQACERLGQTARFLADVNLAWKLAEKASKISLQCRYLLIITSINSIAKNIPPGFLIALVKTGIWTIEQGVAYAQQVTEPEQRFRVLTGLVSLMAESKQEEVVQKTVEAARKIENRNERISALIELVTNFSKPSLTKEVVREIQNIDDERIRIELLERLFSHLSESQAIHVLNYIQTIENELVQVEALVLLTQHLPEQKKEEAFSIALDIKNEWFRAEALAEIARHNLPESLLKEAFRAAQTISNKENQARALVGIGPFLPEPPWEELLTLAKVIKNPQRRDKALAGLIPKTPPIFLQKMLATIHAIESEKKRADELIELLPHLRTEPLVKEAFTIAQSLVNEEVRIKALMKLAPQMTILGLSQEFFAEVQNIKDKDAQLKVIPILAIYGHFQQALNIINMIESTGKRDDALIELVSTLKSSEHYEEAFFATQIIKSEWRKAAMLSWLSYYLPEKSLRTAFEVVETFEDNNNQIQALIGLIPKLAELGYSREALDKAKNIRDKGKQSKILSRLAIHLPRQLLKEALLLIQIEDSDERTTTSVDLSLHLPEPFLKEVLSEIQAIRDETTQVELLLRLVPYLPEPLLREALKTAQEMKSKERQIKALVGLLPPLAELGYPQEVLTLADSIEDEYERITALMELSLYLLKLNYHQEALIMIQRIENERKRAEALTTLIPYLPESLLKQTLDLASKINGESSRVGALIGLASCLPNDVLEAMWRIRDENDRLRGLVNLASYLTEPSLKKVLAHLQTVQNKHTRRNFFVQLVPHLPDSLLKETAETLQALGIHWKDIRRLERLAPYLPESLLRDVLDETLKIEDEYKRVKILIGLIPVLPEPLLKRVLILTQMIGYRETQAKILVALTPYLSEPLLEEALAAVQRLLRERNIGKSLLGMLPKLLEFGYSQEALAIIENIDDEDDRAKAISEMVLRLADLGNFQEAIKIAQLIPNKATRANTLIELAPRLPEQFLEEVVENLLSLIDKKYLARVLGQLASQIEQFSCSLIYPIWRETSLFITQCTRQDLLSDLRALMPVIAKLGGQEAIVELFHAIQDVGRWWP